VYDLLIVGSGPAGLAAATHAQANALNYVLLERADHIADTVFAYQARKFVMSEPSIIPARSPLPFQAGSREAILDAWQRHCDDSKLNIEFKAELTALAKEGDHFVAQPSEREAEHVLQLPGDRLERSGDGHVGHRLRLDAARNHAQPDNRRDLRDLLDQGDVELQRPCDRREHEQHPDARAEREIARS